MKNIGFVGPYCTANFGDWAMLINNMTDLGDNTYCVFTYSSRFPHEAVKKYFPLDGRIKVDFVEIKIVDRNYNNINPSLRDCMSSIDNLKEIESMVKSLDMLIVSGGGWINDNWCGRWEHLYKVMIPIVVASRNDIPVKFMSQGIGPVIKTKYILKEFFDELKQNTVVAIRDLYKSEYYLNEFSSLKSVFVPDDLGFINSALIDENTSKINKNYILIIPNDKIQNLKNHKDIFVKFSKIIKEKYGLDVVFLSFDLVWFGDEQVHYLGNNVENSEYIEISPKDYISIEKVFSYIKNARFLITERYHASVVALQTNTPFIVKLDTGIEEYAYNKAHGVLNTFLDDIEYNENYLIQKKWDDIFNFVYNNYEKIVKEQNKIFNSTKYTRNIKHLYDIRQSYINQILNDDLLLGLN